MPADGEYEKVTLLGPAPWGGTYTSPRSDPKVAELLAKGYTVYRTWTVTYRDGKPVQPTQTGAEREETTFGDHMDERPSDEAPVVVATRPDPYTESQPQRDYLSDGTSRPAFGTPTEAERCTTCHRADHGPGTYQGHPFTEPARQAAPVRPRSNRELDQAQHDVNRLYFNREMSKAEWQTALAAITAERDAAAETEDPRAPAVRDMLARRYRGAVPVTDEMVQAVLAGLDAEGSEPAVITFEHDPQANTDHAIRRGEVVALLKWSGDTRKVYLPGGTIIGRLYRSDGKRQGDEITYTYRAWTASDRLQCTVTDTEVARGASLADAVAALLQHAADAKRQA